MEDLLADESGVDMDMDFGNLLEEIETVVMQVQEEDEALGRSLGPGEAFPNTTGVNNPVDASAVVFATPHTRLPVEETVATECYAPVVDAAVSVANNNAPSASLSTQPIFTPQMEATGAASSSSSSKGKASPAGSSLEGGSTLRANMKLMLMKQRMEEEQRRHHPPPRGEPHQAASFSLTSLFTPGVFGVDFGRRSNAVSVSMPHIPPENPIAAGSFPSVVANSAASPHAATSVPSIPIGGHAAAAAPALRLMNPTRLFVEKHQERKSFEQRMERRRDVPQRRPSSRGSSGTSSPAVGEHHLLAVKPRPGSRPSRGNSPAFRVSDGSLGSTPANDGVGCGSTGTSVSELDDLFEEIAAGKLEPAEAEELDAISGMLKTTSMTMPEATTEMGDPAGSSLSAIKLNVSASCPAEILAKLQSGESLTEEEVKLYLKDRQKKDNHNQIERRRRFNINDRIKELGAMLPKSSDPDFRANKGSILKSTVDYIKKLEGEREKLRRGEAREKELCKHYEKLCKTMFLRIQELEKHAKDLGYAVPGGSGGAEGAMASLLSNGKESVGVRRKSTTERSRFRSAAESSSSSSSRADGRQARMSAPTSGAVSATTAPLLSAPTPPLVTLSPPEYQGYSVAQLPNGRISQTTSHHRQQQQQHVQQPQQLNSVPLLQLAGDAGSTITLVPIDPTSAGTGRAGENVFRLVKQEPMDQMEAQAMEFGVDCSDLASMQAMQPTLQAGAEMLMVDWNQAGALLSSGAYSPQCDDTVTEALELV